MENRLPWFYLGLALAQAAHSLEEVLTGLWRWMPVVSGALRARLAFFPVLGWSETGFAAANLVIVAVLLGFSPLPFLNRTWAWKVATLVAMVETLNGLNHIGAALVTGGYFPGCLTAAALLLFSVPVWGRRWIFRKG